VPPRLGKMPFRLRGVFPPNIKHAQIGTFGAGRPGSAIFFMCPFR
jgi:hypothetical protein